jgi:hypothetical protein
MLVEPDLDHRALADPGMAGQVARLVAAVHAATPALAMPFVERVEVTAEELLRRPDLLAMLDRVQALGAAAAARPHDRVLCHGDLIGDNLLVDRAGRLWVVDWDGAKLAPREADLALFAGGGFGRLVPVAPARAGGPHRPHPPAAGRPAPERLTVSPGTAGRRSGTTPTLGRWPHPPPHRPGNGPPAEGRGA